MYASGGEGSPVEAIVCFLSHCDPEVERLFCRPKIYLVKFGTLANPFQRMFTDFMSNICANYGTPPITLGLFKL